MLRGREISTVWVGLSGAWTWSGAAGARPKLGREKPPRGWWGAGADTGQAGSWGPGAWQQLGRRLSSEPASLQARPRLEGQAPDPTPAFSGPADGKRTGASQNLSLLAFLLWVRHQAGPGQCVLPCPPGAPCHTRGLKASSNLKTVTAHISVTNPNLPGRDVTIPGETLGLLSGLELAGSHNGHRASGKPCLLVKWHVGKSEGTKNVRDAGHGLCEGKSPRYRLGARTEYSPCPGEASEVLAL